MRTKRLLYAVCGAIAFYFLFIHVIGPQAQLRTPICGACHATRDEYISWRQSPHNDISCSACHAEPGAGGRIVNGARKIRNLAAWVSGRPSTAQAWANDDNCLVCHDKVLFQRVGSRGVMMSHKQVIEAGWRCARCHASVGHKTTLSPGNSGRPTMDACLGCHRKGGSASAKCSTCHADEAGITRRKPVSRSTMGSLAHTGNWRRNHGMAGLDYCRECHGPDYCVQCHRVAVPHEIGWTSLHGKKAKQVGVSSCYQCHDQKRLCDACHKEPMPHELPYRHNPDARTVRDDCSNCHLELDCARCHQAHHGEVFRRKQS